MNQIKSLLSDGSIDDARKLAFRLIHTPSGDKVIEMFRAVRPDNRTCRCGVVLEPVFSEAFLKYKSTNQCEACTKKEEEARKQEDVRANRKKYEKFLGRQKESEVLSILDMAGVPELFIGVSLQDFKTRPREGNYFITGGVGVGKTYLSAAMLREYIEDMPVGKLQGEYHIVKPRALPIFANVTELLLDIRSSFSQDSTEDERELINRYADTPFLVLDDLGIEKTSEWALQTLYMIINRRCTDTTKRTIITSNLTLELIAEKLDERISSRIKGMCKVLEMQGNDRRLKR